MWRSDHKKDYFFLKKKGRSRKDKRKKETKTAKGTEKSKQTSLSYCDRVPKVNRTYWTVKLEDGIRVTDVASSNTPGQLIILLMPFRTAWHLQMPRAIACRCIHPGAKDCCWLFVLTKAGRHRCAAHVETARQAENFPAPACQAKKSWMRIKEARRCTWQQWENGV